MILKYKTQDAIELYMTLNDFEILALRLYIMYSGKIFYFLLACTWGLKHDKSINHQMTSYNVWHFFEIRLSIFVAFILTVFLAVFCCYRIITTAVLKGYSICF